MPGIKGGGGVGGGRWGVGGEEMGQLQSDEKMLVCD